MDHMKSEADSVTRLAASFICKTTGLRYLLYINVNSTPMSCKERLG